MGASSELSEEHRKLAEDLSKHFIDSLRGENNELLASRTKILLHSTFNSCLLPYVSEKIAEGLRLNNINGLEVSIWDGKSNSNNSDSSAGNFYVIYFDYFVERQAEYKRLIGD